MGREDNSVLFSLRHLKHLATAAAGSAPAVGSLTQHRHESGLGDAIWEVALPSTAPAGLLLPRRRVPRWALPAFASLFALALAAAALTAVVAWRLARSPSSPRPRAMPTTAQATAPTLPPAPRAPARAAAASVPVPAATETAALPSKPTAGVANPEEAPAVARDTARATKQKLRKARKTSRRLKAAKRSSSKRRWAHRARASRRSARHGARLSPRRPRPSKAALRKTRRKVRQSDIDAMIDDAMR